MQLQSRDQFRAFMRRWAIWLLVAAMVARGVMPAGMMVDVSAIASLPIKICTGLGSKIVWIDARKTADEKHMGAQHDCVLCAAPVQAGGNGFGFGWQPLLFAALAVVFFGWSAGWRRRDAVLALPRGPPVIA